MPTDDALSLLPWQEEIWRRLVTALDEGRLPHALLIQGPQGVGKDHLARRLAAALLCHAPGAGGPCGHCDACHRVARQEHPDLAECHPEEGKRIIRVDAVRELIDFLALSAHGARGKVVIFAPAEALNVNAANSLLKTLEEPPADSTMILVSHLPGRLPATIRSRCQRVAVPLPPRLQALKWLQGQGIEGDEAEVALEACGGAPLRAWEHLEQGGEARRREVWEGLRRLASGEADVLELAQDWASQQAPPERILEWWVGWLLQLRRLQHGLEVKHPPPGLEDLRSLPPHRLHEFADRITQVHRWLEGPVNIRLQLADLLYRWQRLSRMTRRSAP